MKVSQKKHISLYFLFLFALVFSLLCSIAAHAEPEESGPSEDGDSQRILTVAFPQSKGITEKDADGTRHGLFVDYLNEIAKYTGWTYEYVDLENPDTILDDFEKGCYDLMGGQFYSEGFEQYYGYPDYNMGYSHISLFARRNDDSILSNDLESFNGKTIGVYANAHENIRRLKEYLSTNNLNCEIREYSYKELDALGSLFPYLENGDIDLLLSSNCQDYKTFRAAASFNSQPYYIVTSPGNQEILDGLNMALKKIYASNPNYGEERFNINFPDSIIDIMLSSEEQAYIQEKKTVTVAVPEEYHPLFCMNTTYDSHDGLVPDILDKISDFTQLEFSYVYAETYQDAVYMVQENKADILGFFLGSEADATEDRLACTASFANLNNIIVRNKSVSYPDDNLTGGFIKSISIPQSVHASETLYYDSVPEALNAVNSGDIDFVYGLSAQLEQEIQRHYFSNITPVSLVNETSDICFAMPRPADPDLLTIFNKAINNMSFEEKNALLNKNMISIGTNRFSLKDFVYAQPITFVCILTVFLLILVAATILISHMQVKSARIQSSLDKAEAENRAKGEFLSRMSHEIRTPMNAITGLADLTCMIEDIPADVHENLTKIRISSQYLLNLINDILDMSRIDNEMLSIKQEYFYLEEIIDNIKSMMEPEADRHGLTFKIQKQTVHDSLTGDPVRLRQVLTNLLSNAFKFTPEGGFIQLNIKEHSATDTEAAYFFSVIDNGIGISAENQEKIFNSFEQLGSSTSQSQGTGLGLPICQSIIKLMGGVLELKSAPGQGSEFYFTITLPFCQKETKEESISNNRELEDVHILLVEDNDLNAEIAIQLLGLRGAHTCRCSNGREALARFQQGPAGEFQIILMDIQMPVMNGLEATRAIRSLPRPDAASIPIIAMSANSFQKDVDAALEAGINDYIPKPFDINLLYETLYRALNMSS